MWDYLSGFFMVFVAGCLWIGIGISVSCCSARGWNYKIVQGMTFLGGALICGAVILTDHLRANEVEVSWFGFLMCCLGGIANYYNYILTEQAMRRGPNGLVWGIMQSGLIGSFLMGVIFFGEKPTVLRLIGLLLILGGLLAMGISKNKKTAANGQGWLLLSLGALLLAMTSQCFNTLPSYFPEMGKNSSAVRTFGMYSGGVIGFALTTLPGMIRRRDFGGRGEWMLIAIQVAVNTSASLFFFYRGVDILVKLGCGGLGYPLAIGACVFGFSLYSLLILKEKYPRASLLGLGAVCAGIILIAMRF